VTDDWAILRDGGDGFTADEWGDGARALSVHVAPCGALGGYVQCIRGGEGGYFAVCMRCGSNGFIDRATQAEAVGDLDRHGVKFSDVYGEFTGEASS
jgi:hypothetical protein